MSDLISQTFFFRVQILGGRVKLAKGVEDFAWVAKSEVGEYLTGSVLELSKKML